MRFLVITIMALFLLVPQLQAQDDARVLDLGEVLQKALGTNEQVEIAKEDVEYARLLRGAAWNAFLPNATVIGNFVRNDTEISFPFGEDGETLTFQNAYDYSYTFNVDTPIYLGGIMIKTVEQSGINIGLNENNLSQAQRTLIFQVSAAYAQVVKAQRDLEIYTTALDLSKRQLKHAQTLFDAGEGIRTSILRAKAQVALSESELIQAENTLAKAKQDLKLLVDINGDFNLKDFAAPAMPTNADGSLVGLGLENRLDLKAYSYQKEINQLEIEKAFSEKLPMVNFNYAYVKQRSGFPTDTFWKATLNVTWSVFDSGASTVKKAQKEVDQRKLELGEQLLRRQIRAEIVKAHLDYTNVQKAKVTAAQNLEAVKQAYEDIERFYQAGEATDLDVQDLRKQLIDAEIFSANLETEEKLALLQLRYALGLPAIEVQEVK
jgi:outer membrane protein